MKLKILLSAALISLIVLAVFSVTQSDAPFALAAAFPREGALVYVQVEDLPALIKLWNESSFKTKYVQSENFAEFQNGHLGRKLASRWHEFSSAAGFSIDLETVAELAQNKAALGVYDVGKLEFVFMAPVSAEVFAATKFALNQDRFEAQMLDKETAVYRVKVEADRGRQNQELIFCYAKGRFILTTSERLMAQTLQNLSGASGKNALFDAPDFSALKDKITPHLAAVWVNQAALNKDYYFKHYWLMPESDELKNIRAGIFDFEIEENKIIENRRFLLENEVENRTIDKTEADRLVARIPQNVPFYQLQTADAETIDKTVQKTFFERGKQIEKKRKNHFSGEEFFRGGDEYYSSDYDYLGSRFDETIDDENDENESSQIPADKQTTFSDILRSAQPRSVLTFTRPQILPAPLFLQFDRVAVFYLAAPEKFNRDEFEKIIAQKFIQQTMITAPGVKLEWQIIGGNNSTVRRTLALPMLGINVSYIINDYQLILSNSGDLLTEVAALNDVVQQRFEEEFAHLSVIDLSQRDGAYDCIFNLLAEQNSSDDFFNLNIRSLLDSFADIKRIEMVSKYQNKLLEESLTLIR